MGLVYSPLAHQPHTPPFLVLPPILKLMSHKRGGYRLKGHNFLALSVIALEFSPWPNTAARDVCTLVCHVVIENRNALCLHPESFSKIRKKAIELHKRCAMYVHFCM